MHICELLQSLLLLRLQLRLADVAFHRGQLANAFARPLPNSSRPQQTALTVAPNLPANLSAELDIARATDSEVGVEAAIVGSGSDLRASVRRWLREVGVIESIEECRSKLER
jgi:hypothetical protein